MAILGRDGVVRPTDDTILHCLRDVMKRLFLIVSCVLLPTGLCQAAQPFPGEKSDFQGFTMYHDAAAGRRIVIPKKVAAGRPWVWRARFWGHEPQFDRAMLERGWHVAFCDVGNLFGSPRAVEVGDTFYDEMVSHHELSTKPVLEGMSRGGLFIYNWAAANPDKVTAIYGDAPVMDFTSWPGGQQAGKTGPGAPAAWKACLKAYGLSQQQAAAYRLQPLDRLGPLAAAGVPVIHVVGDADTVVPVAENTAIAEERYRALGGAMTVIHKPGVGHHPHSLEDPAPIVAFVVAAWTRAQAGPAAER